MINREKIKVDKTLFLSPKTHITTITSGFGSMGKTWIAVTLSHALNMLQKSVLLFDANNGLLNADFQLDSPNKYGLEQVINGEMTLNQVITSLNKKKFDIICGQAGSDLLEGVPLGRLQILRDELLMIAQNYNEVVIDVSSSEKILYNLLPSSKIILVCTNEPSNLVSTYDFLRKNIKAMSYKSLQIVINYANSYEDGVRTYDTLRDACEQYMTATPKLLGIIRRDTKVRDAIRNHVLLLSRYPTSEAAEDILNIARKLWIEEAECEL